MMQPTVTPNEPGLSPSLNPGLRSHQDDTHDTVHSTPPPADSASVQKPEGEGWPMVWMIAFGVSVAAAIYILLW
jgi:hypothetical protein